jgi:hypothetical protein
VAKAADALGVISDTSHSVPTANPRMRTCVAALHKPFQDYFVIMLQYLAALEDQNVLTNVPVWVNGNFMAITKTHFDDYLNFVVVLKGRKFFYGWTGQQSSSGFCDRPREPLGVFASLDRF